MRVGRFIGVSLLTVGVGAALVVAATPSLRRGAVELFEEFKESYEQAQRQILAALAPEPQRVEEARGIRRRTDDAQLISID